MRNLHIVKRSVLGSFGVKSYGMKCPVNLSIESSRLGETRGSLRDLCERFAPFAVKSFLPGPPEHA